MEREWLNERHQLFVKNIVKDFFECYAFFKELRRQANQEGIRYGGLDSWVGSEEKKGRLWILKDLCHLIWSGEESGDEDSDGVMLDWMIGAIFHEAMKLKENAYMIERYQATFPDKAAAILNGTGTKVVQEFFQEMTHEAEKGIARIGWLFEHAEGHLFQVMKKERSNPLLVRFLLNIQEISDGQLADCFDGPRRLLAALFPDGYDRAYCLAGESYLEGGWFMEAREAFDKALKINPSCHEARKGLRLLEKRIKELAEVVGREFKKNGHMSSHKKAL